MSLRLYNTLTRTDEVFTPGPGNTVRMYTCGLTVYARGHIGNFRTFVCLDVLRRTLKYVEGYRIRHVVNFTDVDDRTIAGGGPTTTNLSGALSAAREELIGATRQGGAGRAALECYADRVDGLLQRLYFDAPPASRPAALMEYTLRAG